jgi:putative NADPH-quinone reductase
MKGWIDRVFRYGLAYDFPDGDESGAPIGLLKAQTALVFNTSNTPRERELRVFGDPLELIWRNCIFAYCGVTNVRRRMFEMVVTSTAEQRKSWLDEVREMVQSSFPPTMRGTT